MSNFEFEYSTEDFDLVSGEQIPGTLTDSDYVRITVYPTEAINQVAVNAADKRAVFYASTNKIGFRIVDGIFGQIIDSSTQKPIQRMVGGPAGKYNDFPIYTNKDGTIYIKPNEAFNEFELPQGYYKIQVDFLNQVVPQPFSGEYLSTLPFPFWFQEFDIQTNNNLDVLDGVAWNDNGRPDIGEYVSAVVAGTIPMPPYYDNQDPTDQDEGIGTGLPPQSPLAFINPLSDEYGDLKHFDFIIRQISTSRREVRLEISEKRLNENSPIIGDLTELFNTKLNGDPSDTYQFGYLLNIGTGDHIPIMNYHFDDATNGKHDQSLILRLYDPLPSAINTLNYVTIEKEVLTTQIENTYYFSDVPDVYFGDGLQPDFQENWINSDGADIGYQNYNDLSSSINLFNLEGIVSKSNYEYENLNIDYNKFENHTFFGSAKKKLQNFKRKVETIQGYYSKISSSLFTAGETIISSSDFLKNRRKSLFQKVSKEIQSFTPYERFLYFDGQSESTASAPGIGKNYAPPVPVATREIDYTRLEDYDGFNVVYKHTNKNLPNNQQVNLVVPFRNLYKVHEKPFFNYSGSIYLSFLCKGSVGNGGITSSITQHNVQGIMANGFQLPYDTAFTSSLFNPIPTGSEYKRFIFEESRSYFMPSTPTNDMGELNLDDFNPNSSAIMVLSGSVKTGSRRMRDTTGLYPTTVISQSSAIPFFGSVMPAGNIFNLSYASSSALRQTFITDIKITLTNPSDALPFDHLYHTSSLSWQEWYDDIVSKAETFDTDNIHSFENNLPLYIQESSDYNDMKEFLNLQGEQYDLIRNHIDSLTTINKRGYKKNNSAPTNILPALLNNMGWEAINPFTGSLKETLGEYLTSVTTIDDIKSNTWRKTLNNLLYIYKTKGTRNAVRGLLNVYGYPPDVLQFQEFGGFIDDTGTDAIDIPYEKDPGDVIGGSDWDGNDFIGLGDEVGHEINPTDYDIKLSTGSFGITKRPVKLYQHNFRNDKKRILNLNWWMNDADVNSIEFVYRHVNTTNNQIMLESSGSTNETLWDLRLIPSNDGFSSSFGFRLNKSLTGSKDIATNAYSMSTNYFRITDGQLWNVMLQRMTQSLSGTGTNQYKLHVSLQDDEKIKPYQVVSMSISGGYDDINETIGGQGWNANRNWFLTGSRNYLSYSNLVVGKTMTGSISQIKGWNSALSISRFRQHTMNKFSTVGNNINSHRKELIYHFKLNENYTTSSVSASNQMLTIVDSAPKTTLTTDYSFKRTGSLYTGSIVYGFDIIDIINFSIQDNSSERNDETILINPTKTVIGDLNPLNHSVESLINPNSKKPRVKISPKLDLYRSPQTFIDDFILNSIDSFNLEKLYGNPLNYYSHSYDEFDTFRENFFDAHPIRIDTNKFVRAHENMFNHSVIEGLKKLVPARSTFSDRNSNAGVEIRPTILEKQKYENNYHSIEVNPNTATGSVNILSIKRQVGSSSIKTIDTIGLTLSNTTYESVKEGATTIPVTATSSVFELPKSGSISFGNSYPTNLLTGSFDYITPRFLQPNGYTASIVNPYSSSISMVSKIIHLSSSKSVKRFSYSSGVSLSGSTIVLPPSGTADYSSRANKSFENVHSTWGTSSNDTQFLNYAGDTGSYGTYNRYHIDTRFHFYSIGDNEYYSSSLNQPTNFDDAARFYNRLMISNDFHSSVNYESLIDEVPALHSGRMMGKTRYFATGSDGNIILPANHVTKFSNPFKDRIYQGAQNTDPGILNVEAEDYSTASFYRVKVSGENNELIVRGKNSPTIGSNDRIVY